MRISVAEMPIDKATASAIRHYNLRQEERWLDGREGGELARLDSAPHFLERITNRQAGSPHALAVGGMRSVFPNRTILC